jgi:two-component system, cell cycle sensor histidine kinase and response regulator CckA
MVWAECAPRQDGAVSPLMAGTWCRALFDHAPIGVIVFDCRLTIVECNDQLASALRRDGKRLIGEALSGIVDRRLIDAARRTLAEGVVSVAEPDVRDGPIAPWLRAQVAPLADAHGVVVGGVAIAELGDPNRDRLKERLMSNQRLVALGHLASGVAHDFNNLITAISAYAELVLEAVGEHEMIAADVREIRRAVARASDLTSQLRHFARRQACRPTLICANAVIRDIERMLGRLISCGVSIEQRLDPGLPFILADAGQIEQVLVNLVLNARDAMPSGGTITIETSTARAGCDATPVALEPGDYAVIAVHDTGHGMDAATMQRIFEPFFTTRDPSCGLGMGLATVESIVTNAGGHVGVRSIVGRGSSFTVYLPAA